MPLELVREVDKAIETIILATREIPQHRAQDETHYRRADLRIARLSVSPIFLALHIRFVELVGKSPTTSWTFWISWFLNMSIFPVAIKQIPFVQTSRSTPDMVLIAAFNNTFPIATRNMGILICIDALITPIFHYLLDDISDREQLHYTVIGILLALAYESTLFLLHVVGDSIGGILVTAIGAVVGVQVVLTLLLSLYINHASPGLFGRSNTSSWARIFTLGSQYTLFQANKLAKRVISPLTQPKEPRCPTPPLREANLRGPYSWLPPGYTRLLWIHKRQPSETGIHCQFIVVPLASAPPYEAISYVWGSPTKENLITVDNMELAITSSAYEILRRRQSLWTERVVWIDQICIDQRDAEEKATQVQMMRDIYTRASRVTAWLGNSPKAELVQCFFAELDAIVGSTNSPSEILRLKLLSMYQQRPHLSAVSEFFRNPWFRRVWIIQEAVCAKRLYIIYGNVCMDWSYVCRAIAVLLTRDLLAIFPRSDPEGNVFSATDHMNRRLGIRNTDTMMAFRGDINYRKQFTLSWLLDEALGFESTDPRDMVYALLGLTRDDSRTAITPNYNEANSPASVYTHAMRFLLRKARPKPPVALYRAGVGFPRSAKVPGLASWVPDWSYSTQVRFAFHDDFAAGTRYTFNARVLGDSNSPHGRSLLCLHGEMFDQVEHLGPVFSAKDGNTRLDEIRELQETYDKAHILASTHAFETGPYSDESSFNEAFIRTLLGNKSYGGPDGKAFSSGLSASQCQRYSIDMKHSYETYREMSTLAEVATSAPSEQEQRTFTEFLTRMEEFQFLLGSSAGGKRFCVTKDRRMAIVPPLCEKGDLVIILSGTSMPFLLRGYHGPSPSPTPTPTQESTGSAAANGTQGSGCFQYYELVGCCYVDSAMEGQIQVGEGKMFTLV